MSTYGDVELDETGEECNIDEWRNITTFPDSESTRQFDFRKRSSKDQNVFRKGPAPLESAVKSDQLGASTYPGALDDNLAAETKQLSYDETTEASTAGSRGLLIYFAKLASSPEDELIDVDFIDSLLRGGADINVTDRYGQTIMHEVAREWHINVAQFCMERGADIDKADSFGRTPLHLAAAVNYSEMIHWLISNGGKSNI